MNLVELSQLAYQGKQVVRWQLRDDHYVRLLEATGLGRQHYVRSAALWYIRMHEDVFDNRSSPMNQDWIERDMRIIEHVIVDRLQRGWARRDGTTYNTEPSPHPLTFVIEEDMDRRRLVHELATAMRVSDAACEQLMEDV